jgi:hypothetical protein
MFPRRVADDMGPLNAEVTHQRAHMGCLPRDADGPATRLLPIADAVKLTTR